MRGAKSVQTIGFLLKPVGVHSVHPSKHPPAANPTAMRHPERGQRPRRSFGSVAKRNGQNQAHWRAGIYEGVFVTLHRRSYFSHGCGRTQCAPTSFHGYPATPKAYANYSPRGWRGEQAKISQCDVFAQRRSQSKELYKRIIREIKRLCDATEGRGRGVAGWIPPRLRTNQTNFRKIKSPI